MQNQHWCGTHCPLFMLTAASGPFQASLLDCGLKKSWILHFICVLCPGAQAVSSHPSLLFPELGLAAVPGPLSRHPEPSRARANCSKSMAWGAPLDPCSSSQRNPCASTHHSGMCKKAFCNFSFCFSEVNRNGWAH